MRLIDADALIEHLKEYKTIYGVPMTDSDKQVVHCVIGHIKNLEPTAYDVEAVVAELESIKTGGDCRHKCKHYDWSVGWCEGHCEDYVRDMAIEIVRGKE